MQQRVIVGLGELLWDLLPGGRQLGGAPANFTVMAARLGNHAIIASRLGDDEPGHAARSLLAGQPADTTYLQTDAAHDTGSVTVKLVNGQPEYTIHEPVAWDFLEYTSQWRELAARADAVCFGTLAQRGPRSAQTIREFLAGTRPECVRVFDVNLRRPFFNAKVLGESLALATILKLNHEELPQVLRLLSLGEEPHTNAEALERGARRILTAYPLALVCITMGGDGSLLVTPESRHRHTGIHAKVVDTVGAGDAFTAALVSYYLAGAPLAVMNEAGNQWGAWVAGQAGAMPLLPGSTLAELANRIEQVR